MKCRAGFIILHFSIVLDISRLSGGRHGDYGEYGSSDRRGIRTFDL